MQLSKVSQESYNFDELHARPLGQKFVMFMFTKPTLKPFIYVYI